MLYYGLIIGVTIIAVVWWRWLGPAIKKRKEQRESQERREKEKEERQRNRTTFTHEIAPLIVVNQRPDKSYEPISFVALVGQLESRPEMEGNKVDTIQMQKAIDWAIQFSYLRRSAPGFYSPGPKLMELRKEKNV